MRRLKRKGGALTGVGDLGVVSARVSVGLLASFVDGVMGYLSIVELSFFWDDYGEVGSRSVLCQRKAGGVLLV